MIDMNHRMTVEERLKMIIGQLVFENTMLHHQLEEERAKHAPVVVAVPDMEKH